MNNTNALIVVRNYSNLMLLLNLTRGIVKNRFPDYLNRFDEALQGFIGEICESSALSLVELGYDDKSIQKFMSLSDDYYENINENIFAMQMIQNEMAGEWEKTGIHSEGDIDDLCRKVRNETKAEYPLPNADTVKACSERDYVPVNSFDEMLELAKNKGEN
jgi:hypothetical protein